MTLNGTLLIHTRQNGRILIKVFTIVLVICSLLGGCSVDWWVGDGRGDWTVELCGGYSIAKINSREIIFGHKEDIEAPGRTITIPNYFVVAYQVDAPFICLAGIQTQSITISDEELNAGVLRYYFVDSSNDEVVGPFESYNDFIDYCNTRMLKIEEDWIKTS